MRGWKLTGSMAALVVAGVLGSSLPGMAQREKKGEAVVGFVDLGQITEQIKLTSGWKEEVGKFDSAKAKYREEIEQLTKIRYLTQAERSELETLKAKQNHSAAEKDKIAAFEKKSETMDAEYNQLTQTEKHTEAQENRFKELSRLRETGLASLQVETEKRAQMLQRLEAAVLDKMQGNVLQVVQQVAKKKELALVVDRQAVLYGGLDMTPDVLTQLKK